MAGTAPASDYPRLARKVSLLIQRLLDGEPAGLLDATFEVGDQLTINMATARAIRYFPTWDILTEAVLLHSEIRAPDRKLDLLSAAREALEANADLVVADQAIAAGEHEVRKTLGPLLPNASIALGAQLIDSDRARASNGANPQFAMNVSGEISQLIYSDKAWANREVAEILQDRRVVERRAVALDVTLEVTQAYFDVLRVHSAQRIRKQDLSRTREHLELARRRQRLGASGAADVYRWESELANARTDVIAANTQIELARMNLNRLLRRPMEERFDPQDARLADPYLITAHLQRVRDGEGGIIVEAVEPRLLPVRVVVAGDGHEGPPALTSQHAPGGVQYAARDPGGGALDVGASEGRPAELDVAAGEQLATRVGDADAARRALSVDLDQPQPTQPAQVVVEGHRGGEAPSDSTAQLGQVHRRIE